MLIGEGGTNELEVNLAKQKRGWLAKEKAKVA
jgi:hypothetical protein